MAFARQKLDESPRYIDTGTSTARGACRACIVRDTVEQIDTVRLTFQPPTPEPTKEDPAPARPAPVVLHGFDGGLFRNLQALADQHGEDAARDAARAFALSLLELVAAEERVG